MIRTKNLPASPRTIQYRGKIRPNNTVDPKMTMICHLILMSRVSITVQAKWAKCEPGTLRNMIKGKTKRPCRVLVDNLLRGHGYQTQIVNMVTGETVREPNVPVWKTVSWVDYSKLHGRR